MSASRIPVSFWVGLIVVAMIAALAMVGRILILRAAAGPGGEGVSSSAVIAVGELS